MGNIIRVRVYGEYLEGMWQLVSLDLNLAAQGDTLEEAMQSLDGLIKSFIYDCTVGEDKQWGKQLLARKAPWIFFYKYYKAVFLHTVSKIGGTCCLLTIIPSNGMSSIGSSGFHVKRNKPTDHFS